MIQKEMLSALTTNAVNELIKPIGLRIQFTLAWENYFKEKLPDILQVRCQCLISHYMDFVSIK